MIKKLESAIKYSKILIFKQGLEENLFDLEIKHQLAKQIASKMKNNLNKIGSEISKASGANFDEMLNKKFSSANNDLSNQAKDQIYEMAYKKVTQDDIDLYKKNIINNLDASIKKIEKPKSKILENPAKIKEYLNKIKNEYKAQVKKSYDKLNLDPKIQNPLDRELNNISKNRNDSSRFV